MKKVWLRSAALAAFIAGSAQAADLKGAPVYKAVAPAYDWTGFYAGVNAGIGAGGAKRLITGTGFAGGVQAGFNWQFAPLWFVGIEGDIGYLGINRSAFDVEFGLGVKTDWYATVRGRLGYTNGPTLFYATGGAAFVKVKDDVDLSAVHLTSGASSETASGWTLGAGIETLLGGNWSAKAEYLYIDAGRQEVFTPVFGSAPFDNRFHVYRYGVNYKFGAPVVTAPVLPAHNWSGFYAGVNAGVALSQTAVSAPDFANLDNRGVIDDVRFSGAANAGYNWQFSPNWVAGLEGDIGYLGSKSSFAFTGATGVKTDWYGTLRGRLGYSTGPALLYVTGGAAFVHVKNNVDTNTVFVSKSETATGWTVGGGIEAALAQNWTAKTEYLFIDAGSQDVINADAFPAGNNTAHFNNRFHVFRLGLNYKFGG